MGKRELGAGGDRRRSRTLHSGEDARAAISPVPLQPGGEVTDIDFGKGLLRDSAHAAVVGHHCVRVGLVGHVLCLDGVAVRRRPATPEHGDVRTVASVVHIPPRSPARVLVAHAF